MGRVTRPGPAAARRGPDAGAVERLAGAGDPPGGAHGRDAGRHCGCPRRTGGGRGLARRAARLRPPRPAGALPDALALLLTEEYAAGAPARRRALDLLLALRRRRSPPSAVPHQRESREACPGQVIHQYGLARARIAAHHQGAALTGPDRADEPAERVAFGPPVRQPRHPARLPGISGHRPGATPRSGRLAERECSDGLPAGPS
jgi:hypothetical protein